eukprot:3929652-Pyramimonas_sp.AAC.1
MLDANIGQYNVKPQGDTCHPENRVSKTRHPYSGHPNDVSIRAIQCGTTAPVRHVTENRVGKTKCSTRVLEATQCDNTRG